MKNFVLNNNLPEFIKNDYQLFEAFIGAYYEYLELGSDSDSTGPSDLHKAVGRPGVIIKNQDKLVDIDSTYDAFLDYFAEEVVPISLDGIQTDPRFFLKKVRDLYQAKGTVKSFQLFFKLYFNDEVDVFEFNEDMLRPSSGKYFNFPAAHFKVFYAPKEVREFNFTLASIYDDSENFVETVLDGSGINKTSQNQDVVRIFLGENVNFDLNRKYFIKEANTNYRLEVFGMPSVESIEILDGGSNYSLSDSILINSKALDNNYFAQISSTKTGIVEGVRVTERGLFYNINDRIVFEGNSGSGGGAKVKDTGVYGDITKIDNYEVRSGVNNTGYLAGSLQEVEVPIISGGAWKELPVANVYKNNDLIVDRNFGAPYAGTLTTGMASSIVPVSSSIGAVTGISMNQFSYFENDSDDIQIKIPSTLTVENLQGVNVGDLVSVQYLEAKGFERPLLPDDSEDLFISVTVFKEFDHITTLLDSEVAKEFTTSVPYDLDSDTFNWIDSDIVVNTKAADSLLSLETTFSESRMFDKVQKVYGLSTLLDGGNAFNAADSDYDFGTNDSDGYLSNVTDNDQVSGGTRMNFSYSEADVIKAQLNGPFMATLDETHYSKLGDFVKIDDDSAISYYWNSGDVRLLMNPEYEDSDFGKWIDTGYEGKVVGISDNKNVLKINPITELPNQSQIDEISKEKYSVVRVGAQKEDLTFEKDFNLPVTNVIHKIDKASVKFNTSVSSSLATRFYSNEGFTSSYTGGTLTDGLYVSDYSYQIKTNLPAQTWKKKFKTMMHPIGMILSANYQENITVKYNTSEKASEVLNEVPKTLFRFDAQNEYNTPVNSEFYVGADNVYYKSNAFEAMNLELGTSVGLSADNQSAGVYTNLTPLSGNSFWDFEIVGSYDSESTQTNDFFAINNEVKYFEPHGSNKQELFKSFRRRNIPYPVIVQTDFPYRAYETYGIIDSDFSANQLLTFSDSDVELKAIDYSQFETPSIQDKLYSYPANRTLEILKIRDEDLMKAIRGDNSLVFEQNGKTYYNEEAYERKWYRNVKDNYARGYTAFMLDYQKGKSPLRGKELTYRYSPQISQSRKESYNESAWETGDILWNNVYIAEINNQTIVYDSDTASFKDPKISMEGRR